MAGKFCPNMKLTPPCTFPVQLSTWERLGYMWLYTFLNSNIFIPTDFANMKIHN